MSIFFRAAHATLAALLTLFMSHAIAANFTAMDLAAEEGKFAAHSMKHGMRAAFIEFFAAKSWLLRPGLVDAQDWLAKRPEPAIDLDWKSQITILSASGDLGFSTGPSLLRDKKDPAAAPQHGQFFSIWQRQVNGDWKVLVDHGVSHGPTATPDRLADAPLRATDLPPWSPSANKTGNQSEDPEQQFIQRMIGTGDAYAAAVSPQTRILRVDQHPIDGDKVIGEYLKKSETQWTWNVKLQGASRAGDIIYAVGDATWRTREGIAQRGPYVRVWVRGMDGSGTRWTLAAEVITPAPPVKK